VTIVVDTGVLLGAADTDDQDHDICSRVLDDHRGELLVPAPVIPEAAWQIERNLGPRSEASFLDLIIDGELGVADLTRGDYRRCKELIDQSADLGLGLVDAKHLVAKLKPLHVRPDRRDGAGDVHPAGLLAETESDEADQVRASGHEVPHAGVKPGGGNLKQHFVWFGFRLGDVSQL
jgi:predicted nucleic acid-binding protein